MTKSLTHVVPVRLAAGVTFVISIVVLSGWQFHIDSLKSILPGWGIVKANTAFLLLALSLSLWFAPVPARFHAARHFSSFCAGAGFLLSGAILLEYFLHSDLGVDQWLFVDERHTASVPGRPSVMTALDFFLLSFALILATQRSSGAHAFSQCLAAAGMVFALLALIGYAYSVSALYKISPYSTMALHTAATLFLLGGGILCVHPREGLVAAFLMQSIGGSMARRLITAAVVIPLLLGWLQLAGQRAGLYDSEFGVAACAVDNILIFTAIIIWNAVSLHRLDRERRAVENALHDADRRKDEFLATLAHELRNPLAPLRNALSILKVARDPEKTEALRRMMDQQLDQMVHLVDDLLDVSRITRGKIVLRHEHFSLRAIIDNALDTVRPVLTEKKHRLSVGVPSKDIWLDGDRTRLAQVFSNLLHNAAKYTPDGGHILLNAEDTNDGYVRVHIKDNGIGIPAAMLTRIFEPFAQVDSSIERAQGGLGIGLTLVKRMTELHHGTIQALSEGNGRGSEFTVSLPLSPVQQDLPQSQDGGGAEAPKLQKLRVLVVDDNEASAKSMGWLIEAMGLSVRIALAGSDAIRMAEEYVPDVILLDIGLPDMNGYDVCRVMRSNPALSGSLFVAQTGWGQDSHRKRAAAAGFNHHLMKPVDIDQLRKLLAEQKAA